MEVLQTFLALNDDMRPCTLWLRKQGVSVSAALKGSLAELHSAGTYLRAAALRKYQRVLVFNLFFNNLIGKHSGRSWKQVSTDHRYKADADLFQTAIILANTQWDYLKAAREQARISTLQKDQLAPRFGRRHEYEGFVIMNSEYLAKKMFKYFNPNRPGSQRAAVKYLRRTSIGLFLGGYLRQLAEDPRGLVAYMRGSSRLSLRMRVASFRLFSVALEIRRRSSRSSSSR